MWAHEAVKQRVLWNLVDGFRGDGGTGGGTKRSEVAVGVILDARGDEEYRESDESAESGGGDAEVGDLGALEVEEGGWHGRVSGAERLGENKMRLRWRKESKVWR